MTTTLWIYLFGINLITFVLYGIDKRRAIKNRWRIPEATLLGIAFVGGSAGAWAGMQLFRHKTKHWYFRVLIPAFFVLHIVVILWLMGLI